MTILDDSSLGRTLSDGCSLLMFVDKSFAAVWAQVYGILVNAQELVRLVKQRGILECHLWKLPWRLSWPPIVTLHQFHPVCTDFPAHLSACSAQKLILHRLSPADDSRG